jgi:hypothetical protein
MALGLPRTPVLGFKGVIFISFGRLRLESRFFLGVLFLLIVVLHAKYGYGQYNAIRSLSWGMFWVPRGYAGGLGGLLQRMAELGS